MLKPLSPIPTDGNMLSYHMRSEGQFPKVKWIAVMDYPDCVREYDGSKWVVVEDKRVPA